MPSASSSAPDSRLPLRSDPAATGRRYKRLQRYMSENVLGTEGFVCESECSCRGSLAGGLHFAAGQLSYVGKHYDVCAATTPLRILVVGMDTGRPDGGVLMDARRGQVYDSASRPFTRRNPHMRGTTLALRTLFGGEQRGDATEELLDLGGRHVHLFDAYAMANVRLCSAIRPGSTKSRGTSTMTANCLRHLRATVAVLEPTIVVLQGRPIRRTVGAIVNRSEYVMTGLERAEFADVPVLLASFTHPSAWGPNGNWSSPSSPYFLKIVRPALRKARALATC